MPQVSAGQLSLRHSLLANIINTPGSPLLILLTFLEIHVLQAKVPKSPWVLALAKPKQTYHCRVPLPLAEQSSLTGICCSQRNRDRQWQGPVLLATGVLRAEEQNKRGRNYTQGRKLYSQHEKETTLILQPEWCKVLQSGFSHLTAIHPNLEHNPPVFTFLKDPQTQSAQHKVAKRVSPLPRSHKKRGGKLSVNLHCLHFIQQKGKKCMYFSLLYISMGKEGGRGFRSL